MKKELTKSDLVKVCNDFVEETQALHSLVVGLQLHVELGEVGDGGKHDARVVNGLVVVTLNAKNITILSKMTHL